MQWSGAGVSIRGKKRDTNQDRFLTDHDLGLFVVADGIGGHQAGDVAARTAVQVLARKCRGRRLYLQSMRLPNADLSRVPAFVESLINEACLEVYGLAQERPDCVGMGCTLTFMLDLGKRAVMGHVGDSRLYQIRLDQVHQLSMDHTGAAEMAASGAISPEEARRHPLHHVLTRCVGRHRAVDGEVLIFEPFPGDTYVLCSDGLSGQFENERELLRFITQESPQVISGRLADYAKETGAIDDVTALVVRAAADNQKSDVIRARQTEVYRQLNVLRNLTYFRGLAYTDLLRIMDIGETHQYQGGDTILSEGDRPEGIYVVLRGVVTLERDLAPPMVLTAGKHFGLGAFLRPGSYHATVTADESSQLMLLPREDLIEVFTKRPWIGLRAYRRIAETLAEEFDKTQSDSRDVLTPSVSGLMDLSDPDADDDRPPEQEFSQAP